MLRGPAVPVSPSAGGQRFDNAVDDIRTALASCPVIDRVANPRVRRLNRSSVSSESRSELSVALEHRASFAEACGQAWEPNIACLNATHETVRRRSSLSSRRRTPRPAVRFMRPAPRRPTGWPGDWSEPAELPGIASRRRGPIGLQVGDPCALGLGVANAWPARSPGHASAASLAPFCEMPQVRTREPPGLRFIIRPWSGWYFDLAEFGAAPPPVRWA